MSTIRPLAVGAIVAILWLCALFSLSVHRLPDDRARPVPAAEFAPASGSSAIVGTQSNEDRDEADGTVDLLGNDVSDAVARYTLDATGALYEVHSPQTEIPKLGSPKS